MLFPSFTQKLSTTRWQIVLAMTLFGAFVAIYCAAYWLRFEGQLSTERQAEMLHSVFIVAAIKLAIFNRFRIYQSWSRYVTFHDFVTLVKATTVASVLVALADYLVFPTQNTPRSVFLSDWLVTIVVVGGLRSLGRLADERQPLSWLWANARPVFIVGANHSGEALLREIRRNPKLAYRVVGFIAEKSEAIGSYIGGVLVIGELTDTCRLAAQGGITEVLMTSGELPGQQVRRLVEEGAKCGVSVKILPSYEQLLQGQVDLRPRTVQIEDLLRREPVQLNLHELHDWLDDKVLLVTGSAGSIGSEICRQLLQFAPRKLVLVDRGENGLFYLERELRQLNSSCAIEFCIADVGDSVRMNNLFQEHHPDIVFHAAAYKHVPLMEAHPGEAVKNIVLTTRLLADLAHRHDVTSFVMISSDKAVNPTSIMGTCKRVAELYVQAMAEKSQCRFVTVRFGNVLDSAGSVVPIFREQIANGGPVTVTHPDMTRFFMTIPEASQLVIQAGAMGRGGEVFVLDMGEPVRIVDLATDMIRLSGLQVGENIDIEFIGLRPGEKLYEELHIAGEEHVATSHAKIQVAESETIAIHRIATAIQSLGHLVDGQHDAIRDELHKIVPQYRWASVKRESDTPTLKLHRAA